MRKGILLVVCLLVVLQFAAARRRGGRKTLALSDYIQIQKYPDAPRYQSKSSWNGLLKSSTKAKNVYHLKQKLGNWKKTTDVIAQGKSSAYGFHATSDVQIGSALATDGTLTTTVKSVAKGAKGRRSRISSDIKQKQTALYTNRTAGLVGNATVAVDLAATQYDDNGLDIGVVSIAQTNALANATTVSTDAFAANLFSNPTNNSKSTATTYSSANFTPLR